MSTRDGGGAVKVVILCGGQGTRLREETEFRPKPLVEVGGRPILLHIMKLYAYYGFNDFVLCLGYRGNMIKEHFLNYEAMNNDFTVNLGAKREIHIHGSHGEDGFRVTLADTGLDSMTGKRIKAIQKYVDGDTFMVTYGDGVSNVNIKELLAFHNSHGRIGTVTTHRPISRFGVLDVDPHGSVVTGFNEKPRLDGWVNIGFFVFDRRVFDYLSDDPSCVLEQEPLQNLARDGQLVAYRHEGFFFAMDTFREFKYLNDLWDRGSAPWQVWS
jgi:glucose-1-phosphate cytidylyltransferase